MTAVAFVIPWYGRDLVGGAEQHIFQVTTRLAQRGHRIEVLATCCRSFQDRWDRDHLPEGTSEESGVVVRRFPVRARNVAAFERANAELVALNPARKLPGVNPVSEESARVFVEENIHSPKLLEHLERERRGYQAIVFAPYLYGPTLLGVERARERAFLQPLLHDETYAYLPAVEALFHQARRLLFISEGEAMLASRLYGPSTWRKGVVTGGGGELLHAPPGASPDQGAVEELADGNFVLYLGRRDPTKNTDLLLRAFRRYRASHPAGRLRLALAGPAELPETGLWEREGIVDLGLVPEPRKIWLLAHCRALVQPSSNESYSRTIMEAWSYRKPVVVHSGCLATSLAAESSGGGWTAGTEHEWADALALLDVTPETELRRRGERGLAYAQEHADWERTIRRYEHALGLDHPRVRRAASGPAARLAIHQLLPDIAYGDAISNQALFIKELLRDLGYASEVFAQNVHDEMRDLGRVFKPGSIRATDGLLYHHSIGTALTPDAIRHPGPKALIYHNITPAHFFERWDPPLAKLLDDGRRDLHNLASAFPVSAGDSAYNASELADAGFQAPGVLPIFVDPGRWAQPADPHWMRALQDGRTNLLFVGRVAPHKCQHHLLEAFKEYRSFDPGARLVIVGGWRDADPYASFLGDHARQLGIASHVLLARGCTDAQVLACYRTAHLFWSMSEHEGFCVPVVEAMWFDVPVLAYRSTAVPETLGSAGILFTEKRWVELAALAHLLVEDRSLRKAVIAAQRHRRSAFLPAAIVPRFTGLLRGLIKPLDVARVGVAL